MNTKVMFSFKKDNWETPDDFFNQMSEKYGPFDTDVAASKDNKKCNSFIDKGTNALDDDVHWRGSCWMNPPYGREIKFWLKKAVREIEDGYAKQVCCLLPARTDTKWFHEYVIPYSKHVDFIKGRLKFKGAESSAPFPSMIVIF